MILNGAAIFGAKDGKLLGGGEAGSEVVAGTQSLMEMIRKAVESAVSLEKQIALTVRLEGLEPLEKTGRMLTSLALPMGNGQAPAVAHTTTNKATYGDTIINVYGAQGQDIYALEDEIEQRINASVTRRGAVFV